MFYVWPIIVVLAFTLIALMIVVAKLESKVKELEESTENSFRHTAKGFEELYRNNNHATKEIDRIKELDWLYDELQPSVYRTEAETRMLRSEIRALEQTLREERS